MYIYEDDTIWHKELPTSRLGSHYGEKVRGSNGENFSFLKKKLESPYLLHSSQNASGGLSSTSGCCCKCCMKKKMDGWMDG